MHIVFYIANVFINISSFDSRFFNKTDYNFKEPCIPWNKEITVTFEVVESLPDLLSESFRILDTQRIFPNANGIREHLLPHATSEIVFARSIYTKNTLTVQVNQTYSSYANVFSLWDFLHLEEVLLEEDAIIFHCCFCEVDGEAILFSAPSGTGKTTQGNFWRNIYNARIINGDRCCLKKIDGIWYACGFPLHGTAPECLNEAYPIKAIVILKQGSENKLIELRVVQKMVSIYNESVVNNWNPAFKQKVYDIAADIVESVPIIKEECILSPTAAKLCHDYLYGGSLWDGII